MVAGALMWSGEEEPAPTKQVTSRQVRIDVLDGPAEQHRVQIDLTMYAPARTPAPAVVLAHGFGGDKTSLTGPARNLAERGFTVLTYSARGFGNSTGKIALNSPEYEVTDARQILDWLARQPEVVTDGENDPLVGVAGVSYGGALSLLLAGSDPRVDAIAPVMAYNDLSRALLPDAASAEPIPSDTPARGAAESAGVFKKSWAARLFATGTGGPGTDERSRPDSEGDMARGPRSEQPVTCGNFTSEVCAAYTELAESGSASRRTLDLLAAASPRSVTDDIDIPTLLVQGQQDPLFGLSQADANARQIAAAGGKVKMIWFAGGNDSAAPGAASWRAIGDWFAHHLPDSDIPPVPDPGTGFSYQVRGETRHEGGSPLHTMVAPSYPGLSGERAERRALPLYGSPEQVINPPGGTASATAALPEAAPESVGSTAGQTAVFRTRPLEKQLLVSGLPQTRLSVASVPGQPSSGSAVLFAELYDVGPDGQREPIGGGSAPMRVTDLPADGRSVQVDVALPGAVRSVEAGHHLELTVTTTDRAYASPKNPAVHVVGLAGQRTISLPSVRSRMIGEGTVPTVALSGTSVLLLLILLSWAIAALLRRHGATAADPDLADTPLVTSDLVKAYPGKLTAVDELSLRVEGGQIVGLLGPNGAGKTTVLRMVLGLLRPTSGEIRVFGHRVSPGAPALSRTGSFVETPGFLPHLSALENLESYWAATGRPTSHARFEEVLEIAGIDSSAQRRVGTYGQGMKQRLGIAQAMLGLPDLLVLDEPTNGLDPPQIHRMREILRRYAATGRSVLLSSHLLSEIEQTCDHVVVMREGRLVASGTVSEIIAGNGEYTFRVDRPEQAARTLRLLEGIGEVECDGERLHADLGVHPPAVAVNVLVDAGVLIHQVVPRRRLEDAFLELVGEERH
ncbi:ABC-2 type transport system ATP-binding protein [Saccharopolyspora lacisalsi]|uniref:ABC-2 type transport system ATP-binding protein n=1 Tax=Halosaccharopolyspora lacisalsi TaxID=1000566 RepID=A0A839E2I8_9PSEU|nr:ABC-2 type transport system ATP-binding protein [Halosaccharopolyspora lacisalsi]